VTSLTFCSISPDLLIELSNQLQLYTIKISPVNIIYPELFIKNVDTLFTSTMSRTYPDIVEKTLQEESFYIHPLTETTPGVYFPL